MVSRIDRIPPPLESSPRRLAVHGINLFLVYLLQNLMDDIYSSGSAFQ